MDCRIHHTAYEMNLMPSSRRYFVGRANEAEVALVDQIRERDSLILIFLRDRDDESEIRSDEGVESFLVVLPDALRELDFSLASD